MECTSLPCRGTHMYRNSLAASYAFSPKCLNVCFLGSEMLFFIEVRICQQPKPPRSRSAVSCDSYFSVFRMFRYRLTLECITYQTCFLESFAATCAFLHLSCRRKRILGNRHALTFFFLLGCA